MKNIYNKLKHLFKRRRKPVIVLRLNDKNYDAFLEMTKRAVQNMEGNINFPPAPQHLKDAANHLHKALNGFEVPYSRRSSRIRKRITELVAGQ